MWIPLIVALIKFKTLLIEQDDYTELLRIKKHRVAGGCCQPQAPSELSVIVSHHSAQALQKPPRHRGDPVVLLTTRLDLDGRIVRSN